MNTFSQYPTALSQDPDFKSWSECRHLNLQPQVYSPSDLNLRAHAGYWNVLESINDSPKKVVTLDDAKRVHLHIFRNVLKDAGSLRTNGGTQLHLGPYAPPRSIERELSILKNQQEYLLNAPSTLMQIQKYALVCAFTHTRLKRILPFNSGNHTVLQVLFESQALGLGISDRVGKGFSEMGYQKAMTHAFQMNLTPLANMILEREGLSMIPRNEVTRPQYPLLTHYDLPSMRPTQPSHEKGFFRSCAPLAL